MEISPNEGTLIVVAPPLRFRSLADFLPLATSPPEPAALSIILPPDPFLLETFSTVRMASFFGLATYAFILLEKRKFRYFYSFPREARPKTPSERGMTAANKSCRDVGSRLIYILRIT